MKRALVVGYGNFLRGDDAFGPCVADRLEKRIAMPGCVFDTLIGAGRARQNAGCGQPASGNGSDAFEARSNLKIQSRHCLTPEIAADVAQVDVAVFVDATRIGPRGRLVVQRLDQHCREPSALAHSMEPAHLLDLALRLYGRAPMAYLLSTRAESFETNLGRLSPSVEAVVDLTVDRILWLLETRLGNPQGTLDA